MARARASSTMRAEPGGQRRGVAVTQAGRGRPPTADDRRWPGPSDAAAESVVTGAAASRDFFRRGNRGRQFHGLTSDSRPTCTFSPTVNEPNSSSRWKVRASPSRARWWGFMAVTSVSKMCTEPRPGACRPLMTLNRVVLPAPLGPIRPVTVPGLTARLTSLRAATPPNRTATSRTVSTAPSGRASSGGTGLTSQDGRRSEPRCRPDRPRGPGRVFDPGQADRGWPRCPGCRWPPGR